eukprot:153029-Hanusia_phi.AAC.1
MNRRNILPLPVLPTQQSQTMRSTISPSEVGTNRVASTFCILTLPQQCQSLHSPVSAMHPSEAGSYPTEGWNWRLRG